MPANTLAPPMPPVLPDSPDISLIVPVLDEAAGIVAALTPLQGLRAAGVELIVADGGSRDDTVARATPLADRVVIAPRGRGSQMNAGAAAAGGGTFLFLHADTRLPDEALVAVRKAIASGACWGRFDVTIDGQIAGLAMVATLMNWRSRLTGIATGDQAIFVTRKAFDAVGGYPDIPLMEDIAFSTRMKRLAPPACLRERVVTSGRRWEKHGLWRTILAMWRLRLAYFFGADPRALARAYGYTPREDDAPPGNAISRVAIAILAKAPLPGLAKTRLIPHLGAEGAAALQAQLLSRTIATARATAPARLTLWCAPDAAHPAFAVAAADGGMRLAVQPAGDLGARMLAAVRDTPAGFAGTLVIGTDCPALTPAHLNAAARSLADHDAVLIPAEDGGYVLIGLARPIPQLFDNGMPWGSAEVAAETRRRLQRLGLKWHELDPLWDVDRIGDVARLEALGVSS